MSVKLHKTMPPNDFLLLYNAKVFTNNPAELQVSALAIQNGRIIAVGPKAEMLGRQENELTRVDLAGHIVWPGLIDSHLHLEHYAQSLDRIDCETESRDTCLKRVTERAMQTPKDQWILGHGWNQNLWVEGFGSAALLNEAAPNYPVYLTAKSLHAGWASSTALRLAGITRDTPDPQGGKIDRDTHGNPTGILFENAMALVEKAIPEPTDAQASEIIARALPTLWQLGLTGVHDFDRRRCFSALQILHAQNRLKLRVVKSIPLDNLSHAVEVGLRTGFGDEFLWVGAVKLFADGALGPQTAAMLKPYQGSADQTGMLFLNAKEIFEYGCQAARSGLSLAVHAIGDRANHEVLNAFQQLRKYEAENNLPALRHRIEHVQITDPVDLSRLANLNITASVQPIHATSDMDIADRYLGGRSAHAYAYASLQKSGAVLSFGSDAPVESPNPFWGLYAAVTRRRQNGQPGPKGWYPEQRLTLQQALAGYTTNPAYTSGVEGRQGQLTPGCWADLIVLKKDPFTIAPEEWVHIKPLATMVGGEWVWRSTF
ncbi:MAG: amidohydrolase [Anaerolineaceae bacterium]|nr:amidohydrolase [Anaerolineaceae bacterium]